MLTERYADRLSHLLLPRDAWRPYPTAAERGPWEALPAKLRAAWLAAGEGLLGADWPFLPATRFMDFARDGNRSRYEGPCFRRRQMLVQLVVAECVEGRGRFLDDIINGVWCLCEESYWGVSAHNRHRRFPHDPLPDATDPYVDLFAGETAGLLSWTHWLLSASLDAVSPVVGDRVRHEIRRRILDPYLARDDLGWQGLAGEERVNNWNPWCNSNCLTAALLLEADPQRRLAAVGKALRSLDRFFDAYLPDGGCDEGPGYWSRAGGSLFDCLELLHSATGGGIDLYDEPLVRRMGHYLVAAFISDNWYVNFADGGARTGIAADLVYRYGRRTGDAELMALGAGTHHQRCPDGDPPVIADSLLRVLPALFNHAEMDAAPADLPYARDGWLDGIEMMTARAQQGSDAGLYLAAKGGHNAESHNHNDVGQVIVFADGQPVLIDVGVETYTAKTFSARRYEIWTMQSAYHNLPTINGVQQAPGRRYAARHAAYEGTDDHAQLSLELAGAYPPEAGLTSWRRTARLERGDAQAVVLRDVFALAAPGRVELSLITPRAVETPAPGELTLVGAPAVTLTYPPALAVAVETVPIDDARLRPVWGERLTRVVLSADGVAAGDWELRLVSAVASASRR